MASSSEHLKQFEHNRTFVRAISGSQFPDWSITILFYAALHAVDSEIRRTLPAPISHSDREELLRRLPSGRRAFPDFRGLRTLSHEARYKAQPPASLSAHVERAERHLAAICTALGLDADGRSR